MDGSWVDGPGVWWRLSKHGCSEFGWVDGRHVSGLAPTPAPAPGHLGWGLQQLVSQRRQGPSGVQIPEPAYGMQPVEAPVVSARQTCSPQAYYPRSSLDDERQRKPGVRASAAHPTPTLHAATRPFTCHVCAVARQAPLAAHACTGVLCRSQQAVAWGAARAAAKQLQLGSTCMRG
ncbi:hypothetical protein COCMIDRAFT_21297 [Bipolaris oryzae ATCC 44560]|uniref:Uncharacterized protein n=1 Tax=Bipolaris oryzae ATCC 44560 TaxID=930090 RepID=W6ZHH8_COCMI|nr:uncharacterized protein COCMIDRAFT_21297 [Bipolaris oryzae ATCC 44560]EUC51312.1 hypothetical protein COCMIDRAFT_21297 [Bipolaris oryzae ATCC 44560]